MARKTRPQATPGGRTPGGRPTNRRIRDFFNHINPLKPYNMMLMTLAGGVSLGVITFEEDSQASGPESAGTDREDTPGLVAGVSDLGKGFDGIQVDLSDAFTASQGIIDRSPSQSPSRETIAIATSLDRSDARTGGARLEPPVDSGSLRRQFNLDREGVLDILRLASAQTGYPYDAMVATANAESLNFDPNSKNPQSTATGLFQIIESTFRQRVYEYGKELRTHGYTGLANQVVRDDAGNYVLAEGVDESQFYAQRNDPYLSALLYGYDQAARASDLEGDLGHPPTATDMHLIHFLGEGDGTRFVKFYHEHPDLRYHKAADYASDGAVSRNHNVFFFSSGTPRSVDQLYDYFAETKGIGLAEIRIRKQDEFTVAANNTPAPQ